MIKKFESYIDTRKDIKSKEIIIKAIDKIRSLGFKNFFDNSTVIDNNVLVEVDYFDGYLILQSIMTIDKGRGDASRVLHKICDIADEFGITIKISPKPFGTGDILTKKQLIDWYKRFGFVKDGVEDMKRQPK